MEVLSEHQSQFAIHQCTVSHFLIADHHKWNYSGFDAACATKSFQKLDIDDGPILQIPVKATSPSN